jgi:hypothetical protein
MRKAFTGLVDNVFMRKKAHIVRTTVTEFRNHGLLEKAYNFLKLRTKIKRREQLMV